MADQAPKFQAALFKGSRISDKIDYSGTLTVSREELMRMIDYLLSSAAETDDRGHLKLYINGWAKEAQSGTKYISMVMQPSRNAYEQSLSAPTRGSAGPDDDDDGVPF